MNYVQGKKSLIFDYMSVERPRGSREEGKSIHRTLLSADIVIAEALSLDGVPAGRYELICMPLCIRGADGVPARIALREV